MAYILLGINILGFLLWALFAWVWGFGQAKPDRLFGTLAALLAAIHYLTLMTANLLGIISH